MLSLDDPRWKQLAAGYRVPIDLRPALQNLERAPHSPDAWDTLWQELYHQGDIGDGSLASVPHIVRIYETKRERVDWNAYGLVAAIDLARAHGRNPDVPDWTRESYFRSLEVLTTVALQELADAVDREAARSMLAVVALTRGARIHARILLELTEDEVLELSREASLAGRRLDEEPAGSRTEVMKCR